MEDENAFLDDFQNELWLLGNHDFYGLYNETFEERGNKMLEKSIDYLTNNEGVTNTTKMRIKCLQFYIAGLLTGKKLSIHEKNNVLTQGI